MPAPGWPGLGPLGSITNLPQDQSWLSAPVAPVAQAPAAPGPVQAAVSTFTKPSTALDVLYRSLSLANLRDTSAITYQSRLAAMQEAMRKLYTRMVSYSDPFYTKEIQIALTAAMLAPNNDGQGDEYLVPMPSDFYRLMFVSWLDGGTWRDVDSFPQAMRNLKPDQPMYRIRDNNLWLVGCAGQAVPTVRVAYYPPSPTLGFPDVPVIFGAAYNPASIQLVTSPCYVPLVPGTMSSVSTQGNPAAGTMLYIYNGLNLMSDSKDLGTSIMLYTAPFQISNLLYYRGYIYFLMNGAIYQNVSDLATPFSSPTQIVVQGGAFSLAGTKMYWISQGQTWQANLDGSSAVLWMTTPVTSMCLLMGQLAYLDASGNLWWNAMQITTSGGYISLATDGSNLFILDSTNNLNLVTVSTGYVITSSIAVVTQNNLGTSYQQGNIIYLASTFDAANGRVAILDGNNVPTAMTPVVNSSLNYPLGVVYEILAHDMAASFKVQREADPATIKAQLVDLWGEFEGSVRRDDYQVKRIGNAYAKSHSWMR